jgi:hypothetical protein
MLRARRRAAAVLLLLSAAPAFAQHPHQDPMPAQVRLGQVSFEISCRPAVRPAFNHAVGLLHSFWYDAARAGFGRVLAEDPDCAMAQWGIAMTLWPQMNAWPDAQSAAQGQRALAAAERAAERSERERAWIQALRRFYDGYTPAQADRQAQAYAQAMESLSRHYPDDLEAQVFHALALLAADTPDDVSLRLPREAYAILNPLFAAHPDHPGIAHYLIHACDHPQMAADGLPAARRYAQIAPDAPHALHMPSHIFARLGRWDDDIRSNLASEAAALRLLGPHRGAENRLHALEFLQYAYLQQGDDAAAAAAMQRARRVRPGDVDPRYPTYYALVQAQYAMLYAVETRDWAQAARLPMNPRGNAGSTGIILLAHAMAAAHQHDLAAAQRAQAALGTLEQTEPPGPQSTLGTTLPVEIRAWVAYTRGDAKGAQALLAPLIERQTKFGKKEVELPAREMHAEMLLLEGDANGALHEYEASLHSDPGRLNGLLGAAQAAERLDQPQIAAGYYRSVIAQCPQPTGAARQALAHAQEIARTHARG